MAEISIRGACDLHIHTMPDVFERLADDIATAEICRDAGMRAIVYKCHADTTMARAWHTQRAVPGIKVFGGIVLNWNVGGINPAAVDAALQLGAVEVWMPSYHSLAHLQATGKLGGYAHMGSGAKTDYPLEPICILDGKAHLIPEIEMVLKLIKKHGAILGTSHLSATEVLVLLEAAHDIGLEKVVLTHPFYSPPSCTISDLRKAVELGAVLEFCGGNALSAIPKSIPLEIYREAIDAVGADNCIIASDCGHPRKTFPPETLRMFAYALRFKGVSERDIDVMLRANYERLLDLD